jgi:hypothetical protein
MSTRIRLLQGYALALCLPIALSGCQGGAAESVAPPPPPAPAELPPAETGGPAVPGVHPAELLEAGETHLREGRYTEAERSLIRFLESDGTSDPVATERALWSLALVHLVPESPLQDREHALVALRQLEEAEDAAVTRLKVRWIRSILDEVDTLRRQAAEQQALLSQLIETVEQLKRIDLNRRPTGPPPPPPPTRHDTLPAPPHGP